MDAPSPDRRGPDRLPNPSCPQCHGALVRVTIRTGDVVGYRCKACDETWNVPKPERPAPSAGAPVTASPDVLPPDELTGDPAAKTVDRAN
jgi:hypothetical protein